MVIRDTRRPVEFWTQVLEQQQKYFHNKDRISRYRNRIESGEDRSLEIYSLKNMYSLEYLGDITYSYCRGDDLDVINQRYIEEGINRFVFTSGEIEKYRDELDKPYWEDLLFYPNDLHSMYSMLSWFVCFEADEEKLGRIAPYLAKAGNDRLVDVILQRYQPDREIAEESRCGRTFKLLQSVLDVDEKKAIKNIEKYLASWGKLMGTLKGLKSIGLMGTQGAKSNESLIANLDTIENISYRGFWAWEVALVVRFFGIDDSSFCDHEFYPVDLARYRQPQPSA